MARFLPINVGPFFTPCPATAVASKAIVHHSRCYSLSNPRTDGTGSTNLSPDPTSMKAGLDALPDDVLLQLIKACSRDTPDAGGMPELEVSSRSSLTLAPTLAPTLALSIHLTLTLTLT